MTAHQLSYIEPDPRLRHLPVSDQPKKRVAESSAACNSIELLAALIGGPRQIEIAESLLKRY